MKENEIINSCNSILFLCWYFRNSLDLTWLNPYLHYFTTDYWLI